MPNESSVFNNYCNNIQETLAAGHASEGSYYPALKKIIEALGDNIVTTSLPKHIECGAPDFIITKGSVTVGYIEAKDIGKSLDEVEKSEQLNRYRVSLTNLILTDYLEFRWYVDGERRPPAHLGALSTDGKIKRDKSGIQAVAELLTGFLEHDAEGVGTPKELARRMARLAHRIREGVEESLVKGVASDLLSGLYQAFQETLIPGLEVKVFADMYAQTIAYGLFAARCETDNEADFSRQKAALLIPKTNPFLRDLFYQITGPDLDDEPYKWAVDELVQLLRKANMAEILRDFGKGIGKDDPVVYFYEDFLREYDKKISEMRGVYYTPIPVVSYIVRSIDYLLKNTFKRPHGLADEDTYILDPATGTGTFLYAVVNEIYESMTRQGQMGQWDGYVAAHLLPRIFGFELLMTPYVIAHLKLGLQLKDTGYQFQANKRLGVYLTNTLEEAIKSSEMLLAQYIVKEANAAAEIKKEKPIMVVLGNPPYSVSSLNRGDWINELIEDYKKVDGHPLNEHKHSLQDDYVKFIRFGQWRINSTRRGILGFITNNSYLDNPTFRGMRQSLMNTFTDIYILNLHGNAKKKEVAPDDGKDENVFDIQQGVAICLLVKEPDNNEQAKVHYADIWGLRENKYRTLSETDLALTNWKKLNPNSPFYFFVPRDERFRSEYEQGIELTNIFNITSTGILTSRDNFVIDFESNVIRNRIQFFVDITVDDSEVKNRLSISENYAWRISEARKQLMAEKDLELFFYKILYRPFDTRFIYYHPAVVWRTRFQVMQHLLSSNLALICPKRVEISGNWQHVSCTNALVDHVAVSLKTVDNVFPLYLYPVEGEMQFGEGHRHPNLNPEFIKAFSDKLGLTFIEDGKGDRKETFGPEDIFNYAYAVFHSPTYRTRYAEFLKIDFPRLPLTSDIELFRALADKGAELVSLHLVASPVFNNLITRYPVTGSNLVEKVSYNENTRRVYINKEQYFEGVPAEVWNFHIGGYQVCQKWLKDRKRRALTYDEITHYQKVIIALKETIRLMAEIDTLILGWPIN